MNLAKTLNLQLIVTLETNTYNLYFPATEMKQLDIYNETSLHTCEKIAIIMNFSWNDCTKLTVLNSIVLI